MSKYIHEKIREKFTNSTYYNGFALRQEMSLPLFRAHTSEKVYHYAVKHKNIIARFGRFPHRNAILGRKSTKSEIKFLKNPGSSF